MIGFMLHTHHFGAMPCDDTAGIYVMHDQIGGGVFKNSECRLGAWGGWTPETNTITIGHFKAKAGGVIGAVFGYKRGAVLPLVSPSVAFSIDGDRWLRFNYLPSHKGSVSGVMVSFEWAFK